MRTKIVIFGTSHSLQCGSDPFTQPQIENFRAYIQEICHSHQIKLIAEEMSCDGLSNYGKQTTVSAVVAKELDIQHAYVDLTRDDRIKLNIDDASLAMAAIHLGSEISASDLRQELVRTLSNPVRECCWVARILAADVWPTLFICGATHVGNVGSLLGSIGQDVVIAAYDYLP